MKPTPPLAIYTIMSYIAMRMAGKFFRVVRTGPSEASVRLRTAQDRAFPRMESRCGRSVERPRCVTSDIEWERRSMAMLPVRMFTDQVAAMLENFERS